MTNNRAILDFPRFRAGWFFWWWNGVKWPRGDRSIHYLTTIPACTKLDVSWRHAGLGTDQIMSFEYRDDALKKWKTLQWSHHPLVDGDKEGYRLGRIEDVIRTVGYPEDGKARSDYWMKA